MAGQERDYERAARNKAERLDSKNFSTSAATNGKLTISWMKLWMCRILLK